MQHSHSVLNTQQSKPVQSDLNSQKNYSSENFNPITRNDGTCLWKPQRFKW